jgi:hypothetical protein
MIDPSEITEARLALGRLLAECRKAAGLHQRDLAPHTYYGRSTIANVETGRQHVPREFWQRCERTLNAGGRLLAAADQLEALVERQRQETTQLADLKREREQRQPGLGQVADLASSPEQVGALLDHLREQWHLLVETDNLLGPRHAVRGVVEQLAVLEELLRVTRDATRREVAQLAAQYAESAARLHEDAGDLTRAQFWTGRAMEWVHEAQDPVSEDASNERHSVKRRSFLTASGVAALALDPASARVLQALEIVTSDHADSLTIATDCLNELISHYSEKLSVSPPTDMYGDLLNVRSYAGTLLQRLRSPTRHRPDLIVAAGWLSNLLAVATSYLGDHGSALIWCVDAERRSDESGYPDIAGWAALTRAVIAYYQGRAGRSIELASNGQTVAPVGTVAHAKLAAQEMRARAMLGDAEGMAQAKRRATKAIAGLPSDVATTGVFSIALSEDPPYTATSLLLVKRFREAASATEDVIQAAYPTASHNRNRQSSNYARTLLILGLAEAGLGHVDEAVAAGRAALNSTAAVWPTVVLAGKLDQALMRDHKDAAEVVEYHARYLDVAGRAASEFQHAGSVVAARERNG